MGVSPFVYVHSCVKRNDFRSDPDGVRDRVDGQKADHGFRIHRLLLFRLSPLRLRRPVSLDYLSFACLRVVLDDCSLKA